MDGEEASYYAVSDGEHIVALAAAQDHKRALDGDLGENTGGMGAYSPAPVFTEAVEKQVLERVVVPAIRGMASDGHPYCGVLFVGLMIDPAGDARVIEFNVRFGDPETQPLMMRLEDDVLPLLDACARGTLGRYEGTALGWGESATCIVLASGGYPRSYETGKPIHGLEEAAAGEGVAIFHAGTKRGDDGSFETAGGRVLGVTATGQDVVQSRERAYAAIRKVGFEGAQFRNDIADRALDRPHLRGDDRSKADEHRPPDGPQPRAAQHKPRQGLVAQAEDAMDCDDEDRGLPVEAAEEHHQRKPGELPTECQHRGQQPQQQIKRA